MIPKLITLKCLGTVSYSPFKREKERQRNSPRKADRKREENWVFLRRLHFREGVHCVACYLEHV